MTKKQAIQEIAKILSSNWDNSSDFSKSVFLEQARKIIKKRKVPTMFLRNKNGYIIEGQPSIRMRFAKEKKAILEIFDDVV